MADNTLTENRQNEVYLNIARAQKRLLRLYDRLGTWRAVQEDRKVRNVATVYNLAVHGVEPKNADERVKVFLPRHPHKPRAKNAEAPEWLKRTKKGIRKMVKITKGAMTWNS